jgi:hypothetical protein
MIMRTREGRASFQAEKQNQPLDPAQCLFREEHFCYWDDKYADAASLFAALGNELRFYGACDPSLGRRAGTGDFSAIITLAKHRKTKILYVLSADIAVRSPEKTIQNILQYAKMYDYRASLSRPTGSRS